MYSLLTASKFQDEGLWMRNEGPKPVDHGESRVH